MFGVILLLISRQINNVRLKFSGKKMPHGVFLSENYFQISKMRESKKGININNKHTTNA